MLGPSLVFGFHILGLEIGHLEISVLLKQCPAVSGYVFIICFLAGMIMKAMGYVNPQWETYEGWVRNFICAFVAGAAFFFSQNICSANESNYFAIVSMTFITGIISAIFAMLFGSFVGLDKLARKA